MVDRNAKYLNEIYERLFRHYGPQNWWPGETPFEVMVGAILTQNTNWTNVEQAITNLKTAGLMALEPILKLSHERLARLIRPAGYFNVKAKRLRAFLEFLKEEYDGNIEAMATEDTARLREKLLAVKGVGPETADSILLYALDHLSFVVDAYTHRVLSRHYLIPEASDYHSIQEFMTERLPNKVEHYNEYHALLVMVGKDFCKPKPKCENCPLHGVNW